jgi:hypothetical protein
MQLLEEDEVYLQAKQYAWDLLPNGNGGYLILKNYALAAGKYDREIVDVLICIPTGYNNSKLDMFYVDPEVRLAATGQHPEAASHFEVHAGRRWQRFSRHLTAWRAGIDTLQNFLPFVGRELQGRA